MRKLGNLPKGGTLEELQALLENRRVRIRAANCNTFYMDVDCVSVDPELEEQYLASVSGTIDGEPANIYVQKEDQVEIIR